MAEQDELKRAQKKHHDKAYAKQELHPDAGGLGTNRHSYEQKQRAQGRSHKVTPKNDMSYEKKAMSKYEGGK